MSSVAKAAGSAVRVAKEIPVPSHVRDPSKFHEFGSATKEIFFAVLSGFAFVAPWKIGEWNRMSNEQEWYTEYNRLAKEKYANEE